MFISVVSPPESSRRQGMKTQLRKFGISPNGFFGIMGENLEAGWIVRHVDQRSAKIHQGAPLTRRQIACVVGHRQAWAASLDSGDEWGVVLEDDAVLLPNFAQVLSDLHHLKWREPVIVSFLSTGRHTMRHRPPETEIGDGVRIHRLRWPPNSAVGYAMNQSAMKLRFEREGMISTPTDWPPWAAYVRFMITVPWIVEHPPGPSLIDVRDSANSNSVKRKVSKALWWRFVAAPQPYYWSPRCYWRHSYAPSAHQITHQTGSRIAGLLQERIRG